ncbi:hypothetical protein HU200_048993 [Digitaria exilis]|uniref:BHLH domain-containing protein n=1 Tax=Digitaria exilis TaxID=1010633 RepID=A0A835AV00_9POAL|nr:hypothetical protein HU200_048993 [Digitaria exilis]
MEAKCASIWSEESEMIANLQSMFWNSSDADASLSSPNNSTSSCLETASYDTTSMWNRATDCCFGHQIQAFAPIDNAVIGDKRAPLMGESRKKSKKPCIVSPVLRTLNDLDDETNTELINHSSSWCCNSEDDSLGVCEESVVLKQSISSRGRSRSSKNSQSIYAKKRRERINEKLKTLQQLIPNGTKVDMSTMLEEAVQYVKFLQLQIKLLSSDETWMYAPLAYNHMSIDINLDRSAKQ